MHLLGWVCESHPGKPWDGWKPVAAVRPALRVRNAMPLQVRKRHECRPALKLRSTKTAGRPPWKHRSWLRKAKVPCSTRVGMLRAMNHGREARVLRSQSDALGKAEAEAGPMKGH